MKLVKTAAAVGLVVLTGASHAVSVFEGRLADGSASNTCTVSGASKCAMFYNATLDLTILNDWSIGAGFWSATAAPGSAQALAESAGASQTKFTGWFLPTGDGFQAPGSRNQILAIWNAAGGTIDSLKNQFDGAQARPAYGGYWSASDYWDTDAWSFYTYDGHNDQDYKLGNLSALAVRPGDVAAAVPEPETYALLLAGLSVVAGVARRRSKQQ